MPLSDEKVQALLEEVMKSTGIKKSIDAVLFRDDYRDYVVVLDQNYHCEIREKLILDYEKFKNKDIVKEIRFLLEHPALYDEWERPGEQAGAKDGQDVVVDDSEKYDL